MLSKLIFSLFFLPSNIKKWQVIFWLNTSLLLFLTLSPPIDSGVSLAHADKIFHFIGFGAFSFFLFLGYPRLVPKLNILVSLILGLVVEIAQNHIPHRGFDYLDLVADLLGSLVAVIFLVILKRFLPPNH